MSRLSFDFRSREQVEEFVVLEGPQPTLFVPTLQTVTLGQTTEVDLGLTGLRSRYVLQAKPMWFRRGGAGPRLLPGVALGCDPVAALTLDQLTRDSRFHSFVFTRNDPRLPCAISVRVHLRGRSRGSQPAVAHLGDLSRGGAFVALPSFPQRSRDPRAPPPLIELGLDRPERDRLVVACNVRWLGFLNGEKGFGGSFIGPDERLRAEVARLLRLAAGRPSAR